MSFIRKQKDMVKVKETMDATPVVREAIDEIWEAVQAAGYTSIRDYAKDYFKSWDDIKAGHLYDKYQEFLEHIQHGHTKEPWGRGVWSSDSSFTEYLNFCIKEAEQSLSDLKYQFKQQEPAFKGLMGVAHDLKDAPAGIGQAMNRETYEFYEMLYHYELELYRECLKNPELIDGYLEEELSRLKVEGDISR